FIDTVVVCTMTALVIIITNNHLDPSAADGVALTSNAFSSEIPFFKYLLAVAVILFAFSTMITWSYYGLKAWTYLFGDSRVMEIAYKILFCVFVVVGAAASLGSVTDFSDAMIFAMAFPNIIGLVIMRSVVKDELAKYLNKIRSGEIIKVS
ncbi:MAG: alanine:cation symporter family protein, partial [Bacteroidota bacterium]